MGTSPNPTARAEALAKADLAAPRNEYLFPAPRWLVKHGLQDARDAAPASLVLNVALLVLPAAGCLHLWRDVPHWVGAAYLVVNYAVFLQRFMLTLHFTEHRRLWRTALEPLNWLTPYVLAPLYGLPSGAYRLHHCVMHHVEDNTAPYDLSSTEPFRRDSPLAFLRYWLRFALLGSVEVPLYAWRRGRRGWAVRAVAAIAGYWAVVGALYTRNPVATLYTLALPYALSSLLLMFGNWSQHVFVDPDRPDDDYALTYNCLACPDNRKTYNDGFHIIHHANSQLHWSQLPARFLETLDTHDARDALCFEGIGFFDVGVAVFTGRLEWLADRVVPCGPKQAARGKREWVELMRRRLQPVQRGAAPKARCS
ncbi:fatty acid desaturase [Raphidocelis subcapitata]|uniref:Fatty acid desaturase n=1 Tax=Raphidocelis subcapitata TaxID=307507 RepID=A0A2V0NMZ3_9CHLO|nr:fatty acid desaturase [Raphidocelis subcapitata]|eukprot:GBF88896.1 fatty acid desaturase [Raphidocelis subcapitata]